MVIKGKNSFSTEKDRPNSNKFKFINLNLFIRDLFSGDNWRSKMNLNLKTCTASEFKDLWIIVWVILLVTYITLINNNLGCV